MKNGQYKKTLISSFIVLAMLATVTIQPALADSSSTNVSPFEDGVTWMPFSPLKQTTFVKMDTESIVDDLAYLAAIPTTVFLDQDNECLYTSPLLFYEDMLTDETHLTQALNAREGLDYFMEDWMAYCGGNLDEMTLIDMEKSDLSYTDWTAKSYTELSGNAYQIASELALEDWSFSDDVVLAVIDEEIENPEMPFENTTSGTLSYQTVRTEHFEVDQTNEMYPVYNSFTVPENYRFMKVRSWYPAFYLTAGLPGFEGIINMSIPAGDRDIQVYYKQPSGEWMMAAITSEWNAQGGMDIDKTSAFIYDSGEWSVALTDVPTKSDGLFESDNPPLDEYDIEAMGLEVQKHRNILGFISFGRYGGLLDVIRQMISGVTYNVDVEMFGGTVIDVPDLPPYGCRDVHFELEWDNPGAKLGLCVIGPAGEVVLSTSEPGVSAYCHGVGSDHAESIPLPDGTKTDLRLDRLGECLPGESYKLGVFYMTDSSVDADFTVTYSWDQNMTREDGDKLASASNGAVLASVLNAPMLYIEKDEIPQCTLEALYQLGVDHITVVDVGGLVSSEVIDSLESIGKVSCLDDYEMTYDYIRELTGQNDVIFSTTDPWTTWYVGNLQPENETKAALSVGPASYIAACHGSPLLLIDNHPELSAALVWHNELWRNHADGHSKLPTVSEMSMTGTRIYDFLKTMGYDEEGEEFIITVGGQFDIGLPWDRVFLGKGYAGRFIGSPTDQAVWISRNVFYPQLVYQNPAIRNVGSQNLINGSSSYRTLLGRMKVNEPVQERYEYPVLDTLICYSHMFNTRASNYWGFTYMCADGDIPGVSSSSHPIDDGVMEAINGKPGGFLADMSGSETQPFYLKQAGYDPVYSTNFNANMENLNEGVLLWMVNTHGSPLDGGGYMFWDVDQENPNPGYPTIPLAGYNKESNPWRGYEWFRGSTEEPDTMTMEIHGIIPALFGNPEPSGLMKLFNLFPIGTALDWAPAKKPLLDAIGTVGSLPILNWFTPDWLEDTQDYYDGVIITVLLGRFGTSWYNGTQVDEALGNIHSAGISSVACLPAGKYLHLTLMRHGSPFQIMDPWATSWYSDVWQNAIPRGIALGEPIGQVFSEGISKVGIHYIGDPPQWWWDLAENVCLYGDPRLVVWAPSDEYSPGNNDWTADEVEPVSYSASKGFYVDGHMPFEVVEYPHASEPITLVQQVMWGVGIVALAAVVIVGGVILLRKRKN